MDIVAISKEGTRLLDVELQRGRPCDVVVGQLHRYMGYVHDALV